MWCSQVVGYRFGGRRKDEANQKDRIVAAALIGTMRVGCWTFPNGSSNIVFQSTCGLVDNVTM